MHRAGSSGLPDEGILAVVVSISSRHKTRATLGKEMEKRGEGEGEKRGSQREGEMGGERERRGREDRGSRYEEQTERKGERSRGRGKEGQDIILLTTLHHNYITHLCSDCAVADKLNKCLHHLALSSQSIIPGKIVPQNNTISL